MPPISPASPRRSPISPTRPICSPSTPRSRRRAPADQGRGFALVADEVRTLAEVSEKRSRDIHVLSGAIADGIRALSSQIRDAATKAAEEAGNSRTIVADLETIRGHVVALAEASQDDPCSQPSRADTAAREAQRGAESVSSAAESNPLLPRRRSVPCSSKSAALDESRTTTAALAGLGDQLQMASNVKSAAQQIGAAAEQLSAAIQELSGAAGEILVAIDQISRGAQVQAAATQQASAAMAQIEKSAMVAGNSVRDSVVRIDGTQGLIRGSVTKVDRLAAGVAGTLTATRSGLDLIAALEDSSRRIDRIVDNIALLSVQTTMLALSGSVEAARGRRGGPRLFAGIRRYPHACPR
ncbi:MAG: methyl-accepting chemotaxis protein [Aliidongia sp.]